MNCDRDRRNLHPRIARTIALVPILVGAMLCSYFAYGMVWGMFAGSRPDNPALYAVAIASVVLLAIPVIGYGGSLYIWWPTFRHHSRRHAVVVKVTIAYLAVLSPGILLVFLANALLGILLTIVLALIGCGVAVIVINRKLAAPDHAGGAVPCPHCAYDMRGQHECRCPECGAQFTVGELIIPAPNPYA